MGKGLRSCFPGEVWGLREGGNKKGDVVLLRTL